MDRRQFLKASGAMLVLPSLVNANGAVDLIRPDIVE